MPFSETAFENATGMLRPVLNQYLPHMLWHVFIDENQLGIMLAQTSVQIAGKGASLQVLNDLLISAIFANQGEAFIK